MSRRRWFDSPSWRESLRDALELEAGGQKDGWQHENAVRMDFHFRDTNPLRRIPEGARALIRSQAGLIAGTGILATLRQTRLEPHVFRTLLLRRLRLQGILPSSGQA